jgi:hypothetical protein
MGNAAGTLDAAVSYASGGVNPVSVAIGDVNGDGRPDVVVANQDIHSNTVCVLISNTSGTLDAAVSYASGGRYPSSVAIGDVNGDGRADVVVGNLSSVCVLSGNVGGTLDAAVPYSSGGIGRSSVAIGDVNGDGRPDVVVAQNDNTVSVLAGNASGTLNAAVPYSSGGNGVYTVAIMDVNDDGRPDLVVANLDNVAVLPNQDASCSIVPYGGALPNSTGRIAQVGFTGSPSFGANSLTLRCAGLPPNGRGLFFFGTQRLDLGLPFGNGLRFVGGPISRLPLVNISSTGAVGFPVDLTLQPFHSLVPGDVREFEFWYRDPAAGGAGYNGSDALEIRFCP